MDKLCTLNNEWMSEYYIYELNEQTKTKLI